MKTNGACLNSNHPLSVCHFGHMEPPFGPRLRTAGFFCGGFGGWAHATHFLQSMGIPIKPSIAIDDDCKVAIAYSKMYCMCGIQTSHAHHGVLTSASWSQICGRSSPCTSWSDAGTGKGLNSQGGQAPLHAIALAHIYRPHIISLEQVSGFPKHPHFAEVMQLWMPAGYHCAKSGVFSLSSVAPTH